MGEHIGKLGHNANQQAQGHGQREHQHDAGIDQGAYQLPLDVFLALDEQGYALNHLVENATQFAGLDQAHRNRPKDEWITAEAIGEFVAGA